VPCDVVVMGSESDDDTEEILLRSPRLQPKSVDSLMVQNLERLVPISIKLSSNPLNDTEFILKSLTGAIERIHETRRNSSEFLNDEFTF